FLLLLSLHKWLLLPGFARPFLRTSRILRIGIHATDSSHHMPANESLVVADPSHRYGPSIYYLLHVKQPLFQIHASPLRRSLLLAQRKPHQDVHGGILEFLLFLSL